MKLVAKIPNKALNKVFLKHCSLRVDMNLFKQNLSLLDKIELNNLVFNFLVSGAFQ